MTRIQKSIEIYRTAKGRSGKAKTILQVKNIEDPKTHKELRKEILDLKFGDGNIITRFYLCDSDPNSFTVICSYANNEILEKIEEIGYSF